MAENLDLYFRQGSVKNLESLPVLPGSINITTDEPAIYIDLDGGIRKRVGDVIVVNTLDELMVMGGDNNTPNYSSVAEGALFSRWSTTALYYVVEENALLKWNVTAENPDGVWKQLNAMSDIEASITDTIERVGTLETGVSNLTKTVDGYTENGVRVPGLVEKVGDTNSGLTKDINSLKTTVGNSTSGLVKDVSDIKSEIGADTTSTDEGSGLKGRISALETSVSNKAEDVAVKALEKTVNGYTENGVKTPGLVDTVGNSSKGLVKDVNSLKTTVGNATNGLVKDVNDLQSVVGDTSTENTLAYDVAQLKSESSNFVDKNDVYTTEDIGTWRTTSTDKTTLKTYIDTKETTINNKINTINDTIGKEASSDGTTPATGLYKKISDNTTSIGALNTKTGQLDQAVGTVNKDSSGNFISLQSQITVEVTRAKTEEQTLNNKINALTTTGQVHTNTEAIKAIQQKDTTQDTAISNLNIEVGNPATDTTSATGLYKVIEDLESDVNTKMQAADAMTFKGVVTVVDNFLKLPTTNVQAGDTYKVGQVGKYKTYAVNESGQAVPTEHGPAYVGDLLIALEDQPSTDGNYYGQWAHVSSGYESDYNPRLSATADNKIKLVGGVNEDLGQITIVGDTNSNVTISTNAATKVITIGMTWGTF